MSRTSTRVFTASRRVFTKCHASRAARDPGIYYMPCKSSGEGPGYLLNATNIDGGPGYLLNAARLAWHLVNTRRDAVNTRVDACVAFSKFPCSPPRRVRDFY